MTGDENEKKNFTPTGPLGLPIAGFSVYYLCEESYQ